MKYILWTVLFSFTSIHLSAQCNTDTHSAAKGDSWLSCQKSMSPNTGRTEGHWMLIDIGKVKEIGAIHIWNYNTSNDSSIKTLAVDVSIDGKDWSQTQNITLEKSPTDNSYEGEKVESIDKEARYILLYALDTYGDGTCAGLSELSIVTRDIVSTTRLINNKSDLLTVVPNPSHHTIHIDFGADGSKVYQIVSISGNVLYSNTSNHRSIYQDISFLSSGTYILLVRNEIGDLSRKRFVKF